MPHCLRGIAVLVILVGLAAPISAEVTVSITVTGTIEELIPILQKLQELGLGGASASPDPLKLNVHSVMTEGEAAAEPSPQTPAFSEAAIQPASAKAGESVLITVRVVDPARVVDTVVAGIGELRLDLFDNGTEGDATAGDGVWSRQTTLPSTLAAGDMAVAISAYNANGEPVTLPSADGTQATAMTTETKLTVTP